MDLRAHINKATKDALKHHRVIEGCCWHDGIYYLCFDNISDETTVIAKVKEGAEKKVLGVSKVLKVGHANDCCVKDGILYITHSGDSRAIHRVDIKTLKKLSDVKASEPGGYNGITVYKDGFILRKGSYFYITDKNFKVKKKIKQSKTFKISQGICYNPKDNRIYRGSSISQSKSNYVSIYKMDGTYVKNIHYNKTCELEGVMIKDNGSLVISYYRTYKKKGKKHFEAHLKTLR